MTTISTTSGHASREHAADGLEWRSWPLVEHRRWSWTVPLGVLVLACAATYISGWLAGLFAATALTAALWQFLLPVTYEVFPLGFRRHALGRTRLVPWHAVRSYRPVTTGIVLYQVPDPTTVDTLRSLFLPYPDDEDELLCAVREYLGHAVELS